MREELLFHWQVVDVEQVGPEILNVGRYRALEDFTWSRVRMLPSAALVIART